MFSNTLPTYLPSLTLKILSTLFFLQPVPFSWMSPPTECVPVYNTPTQSMSWVSPQQNMSWVPPATELLCHYNPCPWVLPLTEPLLIFYCHTLREPVFVSWVSSPDKNVSFLSPGYQPTTEYVSVSWVSPPEKKMSCPGCHHLREPVPVSCMSILSPNSTWLWVSVYVLCRVLFFFFNSQIDTEFYLSMISKS